MQSSSNYKVIELASQDLKVHPKLIEIYSDNETRFQLQESIHKHGILTPLQVSYRTLEYIVLSDKCRLQIALSMKFQSVPVVIGMERERINRLLSKFGGIYPIRLGLLGLLNVVNFTLEEEIYLADLEAGGYERIVGERESSFSDSDKNCVDFRGQSVPLETNFACLLNETNSKPSYISSGLLFDQNQRKPHRNNILTSKLT